jgi:hypothetical protein
MKNNFESGFDAALVFFMTTCSMTVSESRTESLFGSVVTTDFIYKFDDANFIQGNNFLLRVVNF